MLGDTLELDFIPAGEAGEKWSVYAKNSYFLLGSVEWSESKNAYEYLPSTNGKMLHISSREPARAELFEFCRAQTELKRGGTKT